MSYARGSGWNDKNEIKCLIIFKKLQEADFPKDMQQRYCKKMSEQDGKLTPESISAKIGNYKSVAGINKPSNASSNTKRIYEKYRDSSIEYLEENLEEIVEQLELDESKKK